MPGGGVVGGGGDSAALNYIQVTKQCSGARLPSEAMSFKVNAVNDLTGYYRAYLR